MIGKAVHQRSSTTNYQMGRKPGSIAWTCSNQKRILKKTEDFCKKPVHHFQLFGTFTYHRANALMDGNPAASAYVLHPFAEFRSHALPLLRPRQPVRTRRRARKNRARAQADGFGDVGAPTNPSVHQYFCFAVHRFNHFRQRTQRGGNAVESAPAVNRNHYRRGTLIDRVTASPPEKCPDPPSVHPRPANPAHRPGDRTAGQGCADIDERHRPFPRDDNVRKPRQAAVAQKTYQPSRMPHKFRNKRKFCQQTAADEFLHAIA